jgi:carbamoyl-phosphate synthase large subunit
MLGDKLKDLPYGINLAKTTNLVAVKAPVFSFVKLNNVDVALTPEMKSTGEVLGIDSNYKKALYKAFVGAYYKFYNGGNVLVSVNDESKEEALIYVKKLVELGFNIHSTVGTNKYLNDMGIKSSEISRDVEVIKDKMKSGEIIMIFNTPTKGKDISRDGFKLRTFAQHLGIPCFTCIDTLREYLNVMEFIYEKNEIDYETIDYYQTN